MKRCRATLEGKGVLLRKREVGRDLQGLCFWRHDPRPLDGMGVHLQRRIYVCEEGEEAKWRGKVGG